MFNAKQKRNLIKNTNLYCHVFVEKMSLKRKELLKISLIFVSKCLSTLFMTMVLRIVSLPSPLQPKRKIATYLSQNYMIIE